MARKIEVDLVANAKPFNNALDAAVGKVTGFSGRLKALGGGSIGKGLAIGAGIQGFNLLTTAIETGISKMDEFHQAYLADQESQLRLQNVLKNTTKSYDAAIKSAEDFAGAQQKLGFEDDDVRASLAQLVGITHDITEAQKLSGIAMDLARAKNIDIAQATDTVARAYTGVARGLTLVGIDARGAATGLELVNRIAQNTKGAAEQYAKSGAGRIAAANAKMQDTFEKLGFAVDKVSQIAIPIMAAGLGALVDGAGAIIGAFETAARVLNEQFGPALSFIGQLAQAVASPLALLADIGANIAGAVAGNGGGGGQGQGGVINVGGSNPNGGPQVINIGKPFHTGGVVSASDATSLHALQEGEVVTPRGQAAGQTIIVNIASFIGSDRDIDRFADRLAFRLRATSLS